MPDGDGPMDLNMSLSSTGNGKRDSIVIFLHLLINAYLSILQLSINKNGMVLLSAEKVQTHIVLCARKVSL